MASPDRPPNDSDKVPTQEEIIYSRGRIDASRIAIQESIRISAELARKGKDKEAAEVAGAALAISTAILTKKDF